MEGLNMKYRKSFEKLDTFIEGNNTVDFWEWYYRGKFKEDTGLTWCACGQILCDRGR